MLEERRNQRYLRRPGNLAVRKHRLRRGLGRRLGGLALQAALLGAVVLAARETYRFAITSSWFEVRTIAVRGNTRAKTADLLALAGPAMGSNIFTVDLAALRSRLAKNPWVLEASIRRSLPGSLEVSVRERQPAAAALYGTRVYLVDVTGRLLGEYGPEMAGHDFPVLTGLDGLGRRQAMSRLATGTSAVTALVAGAPGFAKRISELDLSSPDRIAARLSDASPLLYLDPRDPLRNLDNYTSVGSLIPRKLPETPDGEPVRIAYVDLRYRGRIAVMPMPRNGTSGELEKVSR